MHTTEYMEHVCGFTFKWKYSRWYEFNKVIVFSINADSLKIIYIKKKSTQVVLLLSNLIFVPWPQVCLCLPGILILLAPN